MKDAAAAVLNLEELETQTSQPVHLLLLPPQYPDLAYFLVLFPSFGKYQVIFSAAGDMRVHPNQKGPRHVVVIWQECGEGRIGSLE